MSLTKSDLSAIKNIVKGEIQGEVDPLKKDVSQLRGGFQEVKRGLDKLDKKFDKFFNFLDKDLSQAKRRVDYIDKHLGINTSEL